MSIKAVAWYLDNSEQDGPRLLALLALAEWANENGYCFPGMARIAERLRRTERTAQKIIAELEAQGELLVAPGEGQKGQGGHTSGYYLLSYMKANRIAIPELPQAIIDAREKNRQDGLKGVESREGVKVLTPLEGVKETTPLNSEGVKVLARRGEGFDVKGVSKPSPKPTTEPTTTARERTHASAPPIASIEDPRIVLEDPEPRRQPGWSGNVRKPKEVDEGEAPPGRLVKRGTGTDAYWVLREYTSRSMTSHQIVTIRETVKDLAKWRSVCERWAEVYGDEWRKFGHLDWYRNGIPQQNGNQPSPSAGWAAALDQDVPDYIRQMQGGK